MTATGDRIGACGDALEAMMVSMAHAAAEGGVDVHPLYTYFFLKVGLGPRYTEEMAHRDGVELETMYVS